MPSPQSPADPNPQLGDLGRRWQAAVESLERAHAERALPRALGEVREDRTVPAALLVPYERLASAAARSAYVPADEVRAAAVVALLGRARRMLGGGEVQFPAELGRGELAEHILVPGRPKATILRLDQAAAVRWWGIGFGFEAPSDSEVLHRRIALMAVQALSNGLLGVERIQRRFAGRDLGPEAVLVAPEEALDFEQLVLDVLNEQAPIARHAPLHEDFLEKTDLRLHIGGLGRRRGARVQVTRSVSPGAHAAKEDSIRRRNELVLISPLALARAIRANDRRERFGTALLEPLWPFLPPPKASELETAHAIRALLIAAIERRHNHPRGPLQSVPAPLRKLICAYAAREALDSTMALRARQAAQRPVEPGP